MASACFRGSLMIALAISGASFQAWLLMTVLFTTGKSFRLRVDPAIAHHCGDIDARVCGKILVDLEYSCCAERRDIPTTQDRAKPCRDHSSEI